MLNAGFSRVDHYGWQTLQHRHRHMGGTMHCRTNAQKKAVKKPPCEQNLSKESGTWDRLGRLPKLQKMSIRCRNGCVGMQMSQELMTMAVRHCSNVQEGGWHFAVQEK